MHGTELRLFGANASDIAVAGTTFNFFSCDAVLGRELNPSPLQCQADVLRVEQQTQVTSYDTTLTF